MSEFSNFCNLLREKSGMTIYHIAKVSGMERTSLNRMLIGKRFPKYEDVMVFAETIRANHKEREHLKELYLMEKTGKKRYENFHYIQKLLNDLERDDPRLILPFQMEDHNKDRWEGPFADCRENVIDMICSVLEQEYKNVEGGAIYTNFPVSEDMLPVMMRYNEKKYKREIPLYHFHVLNVNPDKYYDVDCNLKILHYALKWKFISGKSYIPYYTYSPLMAIDMELQFMPFYLVTNSRVLLVSNDFLQAIMLDDPDLPVFYQNKIQDMKNQTYKLFQTNQDLPEEMPDFLNEWNEKNKVLFSLDQFKLEWRHLNAELYEKGFIISRENKGDCLSALITESSMFHSFNDYFLCLEEIAAMDEIKRGAHQSAHIERENTEGYIVKDGVGIEQEERNDNDGENE